MTMFFFLSAQELYVTRFRMMIKNEIGFYGIEFGNTFAK